MKNIQPHSSSASSDNNSKMQQSSKPLGMSLRRRLTIEHFVTIVVISRTLECAVCSFILQTKPTLRFQIA